MLQPRIRISGVERKELASRLKADIDAFCVQHYPNKHRNHLGASEIGERCARKLWYIFRWMHREQFDGRMLRLFNRGHQTEDRITTWLKGIGIETYTHQESGEQYHIETVQGHFGGSLDGILRLPERYGFDMPFLAEFKTHNLKSFKKLVKDDNVAISKPKHFAQMNTYGAQPMYNFDYAIYFGLCKDDDNIYVEVVSLDHDAGLANVTKAEKIISSQTPPNKIGASPAHGDCAYCSMQGICHKGEPVDRNCRSCVHAQPVENFMWKCNEYNSIIPQNVIKQGCDSWQELPHR